MADPDGAVVAAIMLLTGTSAILAFTFMWAIGNRRPVKLHAHLTGRPAAPYWHTPTGLQDERGITPWPVTTSVENAEVP